MMTEVWMGVRLLRGETDGRGAKVDEAGGRKVVISQFLINIQRLRAFQRNVIN